MTVVLVSNDKIESAVTGVRRLGANAPALPGDQFQLASLTKGMTAVLIARLVEQNKLRWDSTLVELFPEWRDKMHPALRAVTVEQLLRHRGGIKGNSSWDDGVLMRTGFTGDWTADRKTAVEFLIQQAPEFTPGQRFAYSNVGYQIIGQIAERAGGLAYADLMEKEVFAPLNIKAAFGLPDDAGAAALSGHAPVDGVMAPSLLPEPLRELLTLQQAGGGLMITADNYGKYLHEHLRGLQGKSTFLTQDTFRKIHTPVEDYGMGWTVRDERLVGPVSTHSGYIITHFAFTFVVPGTNRAVMAACNCAGMGSENAVVFFAETLAMKVTN